LTLDSLAERWSIPIEALRRRVFKLNLPAVNVGSVKRPDYRFRLPAIERWEQENEWTLGREESVAVSVMTGAPPGLEGYDPFKSGRQAKGPGKAGKQRRPPS
jgi:hypothetical protein